MSKMHSINRLYLPKLKLCHLKSRGFARACVILAAAVLCGCSHVDVHSDKVRGVAYVRVDDVIRAAVSAELSVDTSPLVYRTRHVSRRLVRGGARRARRLARRVSQRSA